MKPKEKTLKNHNGDSVNYKQETPAIVNRTIMSEDNYTFLLKNLKGNTSKMSILIWSITAFGLGVMNFISYLQNDSTSVLFLILSILFITLGCFIPVLMFYIIPKKQAQQCVLQDKKMQCSETPYRRYQFYKSHFTVDVGNIAKSKIDYSQINKVEKSDSHLLFICEDQVAYMINRNEFEKGNYKHLIQFLAKHLPKERVSTLN